MNTASADQTRGQMVGDNPGEFNTLKDNQKAVNKVDNRIAGIWETLIDRWMLKQKKNGDMYFEVFAMIELRKNIEFCGNHAGVSATTYIESGYLTKNERIIDPGLGPHKQVNSDQECE